VGRSDNRAAGAADAASVDDADGPAPARPQSSNRARSRVTTSNRDALSASPPPKPAPAKALRYSQIITIFPPPRWGRVRVGVMLPRRAGSESYLGSGISFRAFGCCVQRQRFTPSQSLPHPGGIQGEGFTYSPKPFAMRRNLCEYRSAKAGGRAIVDISLAHDRQRQGANLSREPMFTGSAATFGKQARGPLFA